MPGVMPKNHMDEILVTTLVSLLDDYHAFAFFAYFAAVFLRPQNARKAQSGYGSNNWPRAPVFSIA